MPLMWTSPTLFPPTTPIPMTANLPPPLTINIPLTDLDAWAVSIMSAISKGAFAFWWIEPHCQMCGMSPEDSFSVAARVWAEIGRQRFYAGRVPGSKNRDLRPLSDLWLFGEQQPITDWEWKGLQIPRKVRSDRGRSRNGGTKSSRQSMREYRERQRLAKGLPGKFVPGGKKNATLFPEKEKSPVSQLVVDIQKDPFTFKLIRTMDDWEK